MIVSIVKGNVVSTNKNEKLSGAKLMLVQEFDPDKKAGTGKYLVAYDTVGAGVGEVVICVSGSSSRQTEATESRPVDLAIVGIVDSIEYEGKPAYKKYE